MPLTPATLSKVRSRVTSEVLRQDELTDAENPDGTYFTNDAATHYYYFDDAITVNYNVKD